MDHSRPSTASTPRLPLHISTPTPASIPVTPASYIPTPAPTAHPPRFSTLFPLQTQQPQPQPPPLPTHTPPTTTATTATDQPHSFDDCPACRAEYQAAINASLTTDAQQRQAEEEREREELQNAILLSQQQPEKNNDDDDNEDEEELLRRAIEESAREEERRKNWLASIQPNLASSSSSSSTAPALNEDELLARVLEESARAEEEERKKREEQEAWEASVLERSRRAAELVEEQRMVESQEASMWRQPGGGGAGAGSSSQAREEGDGTGASGSGGQVEEEGQAEGKGKGEEDYALGLGLRASRGSHELRSEIAQDEDLARAIADEVRSRSERRQAPAPAAPAVVEEEEEEEVKEGAAVDPSVDSRFEARSQPDEEDSFWRKPPTDPSKPGPPSTSHPHAHSSSLSSISSSLAGLAQTAAAFNDADIEADAEEGAQTMSLPPVQIAAHLGEFGAGEERAGGGAGGRYGIDVPESVVGSLPPSARTEDGGHDGRLSFDALGAAAAAPRAEGDDADAGGAERSADGSAAAHTDAHASMPTPTPAPTPAPAPTIPRPLPVPPGPPPAGSTPMNPNRPTHPPALSPPEVPSSDDISSASVPTVQGAPALTPSAAGAGAGLRLITDVPTPIDEQDQLLSPSQIDAPTDVQSFVESEVGEMRRGLSAGTGGTQEGGEEEGKSIGEGRCGQSLLSEREKKEKDGAALAVAAAPADPPSYTERQPDVGGKMDGESVSHEDGKTSHADGTSCVRAVVDAGPGAGAGAGALRTSPTSGLGSVASGPSEGIPPSDESSTTTTIAPVGPTTQEGAPPTFVGSVHPLFAGLSYNHNAPAVSSANGGGGVSSPSRDGNGRERSIGHASVSSWLGSHPNPHSNGIGIGGVMGPVIGGSGGNAIVQSGSGAGVVHPPTISSGGGSGGGGGRWSGEPQIALALRRTSAAASAANMGSSSSVSSHHTHNSQRGSVSSVTGASVSPSAGYGHYNQHQHHTTDRPIGGRTSFSSSSIISRTSPSISTSASGFTFQQQQQQQPASSSFNPLFSAFGEEAEDADRTASEVARLAPGVVGLPREFVGGWGGGGGYVPQQAQAGAFPSGSFGQGQDAHAAPHFSATPSPVSPPHPQPNSSSFDSATVNSPGKTVGSKTKKKLKSFFFSRHDRSGSKARNGGDDGSVWTAADRGTANVVPPAQGQQGQQRERRGSQPYMNAAASSSQTSLASLGSGSVFSNHAPSFSGTGNGNGTGTKRRSFGGRSLFGGTSGSSSSIRGHRAPFWGGGGGGDGAGRPSLDGSGRVEDTVEELQDSVPGGMI